MKGKIYNFYNVNKTIGKATIQLNHNTYKYNITRIDYSNAPGEIYAGSGDYSLNNYNHRVYSNIGTHLEKRGVNGITFIEGATFPSGTDSLESDYPLWAQKLEQWTVTAIERLIEQEGEAL